MTRLRGHVRGIRAAAEYCGITDRATFYKWCAEFRIRPRIIHGQAFFRIDVLDQFMNPDNNPPGVEEEFWNAAATASA